MPDLSNATPADNQDQTNQSVSALPKTDDEFLRLAADAHAVSTTYFDTAIRRGLVDNLRQFQSQHPTGSKYLSEAYRARSKFFRPKTRSAERKNEAIGAAALFSTADVVSIKAQDEDDRTQLASASVVKALIEYRFKHSMPWFVTCIGAYQDAQVQGLVCSYQYWEYNKKKGIDRPCVKLIPLENVRFDPSADWRDVVNSSPYFIEMIPMYVKDVRQRMKTIERDGNPKWRPVPDADLLKASTMYSDIVRQQREQGRVDPRAISNQINDFAIVWVHRNIVEVDGEDFVYHTLGTLRMLDTPVPIKTRYFHGKRPYVVGFCVIETHRAYPDGPVRLTNQIQGELNENANQRGDNIKLAMTKRWLVKRSAQVDLRSLQRNIAGSSTMVNDIEKDVKVIETNDVTASAFQEQDRLNLDFDDLSGSFSQASVQANRKLNETVGGMNLLSGDASVLGGYQLKTWSETWLEPVVAQMVLLEQHYEADDVVLALAAKKAKLFQRFGINVLTDSLLLQQLTVDVNIGIGSSNPRDQLQAFIEAMTAVATMLKDGTLQNYGLDVSEVVSEIFGKLGYKDGKRFFPSKDDGDERYAALEQQIQQLQAALDAKEPPAIIAAKVKKLEAEARYIGANTKKVGGETIYSAAQTGEVFSAVPQVSPVADAVLRAIDQMTAGADPVLPAGGEGVGLNINSVQNKRTGIEFMPGGGQPNTHPNLPAPVPAPASPGVGAQRGIETMRPDGA